MPPPKTTLPDFVYQETQYNGSNGKVVLRRNVVAGKEPDQWREFLGVGEVELPLGKNPAGEEVTKKHQIIFPFFGISTAIFKNPLKCVQECFKIYDEVEAKACTDTLEHYKKQVRDHIAKSKEIEDKARAEGKQILVPGASTSGERHLDRDGNEIPEPAQPKKKSIILGG
jgi:hypothetical protein